MTRRDDPLGDVLRRAAAASIRRLATALAPYGVTAAEWTVMQALHDAGVVPPSVLAAAAGLTRGAVTKLVDRLRAKRLVVRAAAGREDRRYQTIALTGAGATLLPVLARAARAAEKATFAHLSATEREVLHRILTKPGTRDE